MKDNIFIPKLCKVGFNTRQDTYSGKLGYVIAFDGKKWRKEPSWESWREKYISEEEAEQKKLADYNRDVKNAFDEAIKNGGILREYWNNRKRISIKNVQTIEDIMKVITYEDYNFNLYGQSSDEGIKPLEFDNEPKEGFVLNRKAGGDKYGWNPRQTYCRVYDPRGFEFEITIPNLLYILENTNSIKGKGLEGNFIYGWSGKDLVLVPENAPEYEDMVKFTKLQDGKVFKKDLIPGQLYLNAQGEKITYMGEFFKVDWYGMLTKKKQLWFMVEKNETNYVRTYSAAQSIKGNLNETNPNFANLMDELHDDDSFYPTDPEYVKVEDPSKALDTLMGSSRYSSFNYKKSIFIKSRDHFLYIRAWKRDGRNHSYLRNVLPESPKFCISYGTFEHEYDSIDTIINKHELWQLKTTR